VSDGARTWGLRLLALAIAVAVWYSVSLSGRENQSEISVDQASVSYNLTRGVVVLDPVRTVRVRLRGAGKKIRQLNPQQVKVQVELAQTEPGERNVTLGPDDVQAPDDFEVVSVEPNAIRVRLDREVTQRIPVRPQVTGEPAVGAKAGEPEAYPNMVLVSGPESLVSKIESLPTRPVSLEGHASTFEQSANVVPPENPLVQVVQPSEVTVRVPVEPPQTAGDGAKKAGEDAGKRREGS
jgi:YbbR domain-containing protein